MTSTMPPDPDNLPPDAERPIVIEPDEAHERLGDRPEDEAEAEPEIGIVDDTEHADEDADGEPQIERDEPTGDTEADGTDEPGEGVEGAAQNV